MHSWEILNKGETTRNFKIFRITHVQTELHSYVEHIQVLEILPNK